MLTAAWPHYKIVVACQKWIVSNLGFEFDKWFLISWNKNVEKNNYHNQSVINLKNYRKKRKNKQTIENCDISDRKRKTCSFYTFTVIAINKMKYIAPATILSKIHQ